LPLDVYWIVTAAEGNGVLAVNLMHYGEPALSPYYEEVVRLIKTRDVRVISSSTASEFGAMAAKAAVKAGLDELWLIFDGMDDATFRRMRGPRAGFKTGLDQLRGLQAAKAKAGSSVPDIVVIMIRHPYNRHQWSEFIEFFGGWSGVSCYLANYSTFGGRQASLLKTLEQLQDDPATQAEQERVAAINAHPCRYPWHSVCVLADGRVVPCCRDVNGDLELGDMRTQSLQDIWNGPALQRLRQQFADGDRNNPLCWACREASLEIGVPAGLDEAPGREARELAGDDFREMH